MSVIAHYRIIALVVLSIVLLSACSTPPPSNVPEPDPPPEPMDELTERSLTQPTGWWWLSGVTFDQLEDKIDEGFRIIDLELIDPSAPTYAAALVSNTGVHQKDWWWYVGVTADELSLAVERHEARIIDLETYVLAGQQLFAAVLVSNSGEDAVGWSWYYNVDAEFLEDVIDEHDHRIVDLERYSLNGNWYFSAVLVSNSGANRKDWGWYYGVSAEFISERLDEYDARLVDLDRTGPDTYVAVIEARQGKGWWWWRDGSMDSINVIANKYGARVIDVEHHMDGEGRPRFTAVLLANGGPSGIPVTGTEDPELDPLVLAAMDFMRHRCVGAAILGVSLRGQPVGIWGLGRMDGRAANDWDEECGDDFSEPLGEPVSPDTPMRIGSISKTITAAMTRWAVKAVALQEAGITLSDDQVEGLRLFDPDNFPPLIPGTAINYPVPLIPRELYNVFAGHSRYQVQVSDSGDSDSQALCADLDGFADPQWQDVTLGHLFGHRSGMRRSAPGGTQVVVPNLPLLRGLTSVAAFEAQEQQLRDEFGDARVASARAALGLGTGQGYFLPRYTLEETMRVVAGRCLRYPLGQRVYSNTSPAFPTIIVQQLMASGRYSAEVGRPSTHSGSALDIFFRTRVGVATSGNTGAFLSLAGPSLEGYVDREPTKRDWNGDSYYRDVWDEKRPHCVMTAAGCSFDSWRNANPGMTNWAWQVEQVPMGHDLSGVSPGTGSLAVEAEAILRFLARYWVNGDGGSDFANPRIGEARNGDWSRYVWHNGALAGTYAWALQVGGPNKPASRNLPPINEQGRIVDDFGNLSPVALSLPDGLDIFIAINQNQSDRKCVEAPETEYTCSGAYNLLPAFLYYGASQVDWSLVMPLGTNEAR